MARKKLSAKKEAEFIEAIRQADERAKKRDGIRGKSRLQKNIEAIIAQRKKNVKERSVSGGEVLK